MRPHVLSVLVDDQDAALSFYTDVLGFEPRTEVPLGAYRWLTVGAAGEPGGVEVLLEPDQHPAAQRYKQALKDDGIPMASFAVDDVVAEVARLQGLGVHFTQEVVDDGTSSTAILDDTCGNLVQLVQTAWSNDENTHRTATHTSGEPHE